MAQTISPVAEDTAARPVVARTTGRTLADGAGGPTLRQWPGTYWETQFDGPALLFRLGPGRVAVRVSVDGQPSMRLDDPRPGLWRVDGLAPGPHHLRVQVVGETQAAPTGFGGFLLPAGSRALPAAARTRQIELIGDSHTVGYANLSRAAECTEAEVAATTDTFAGIAGRVAQLYDADVMVNAISGRGVVRNYDGFAAPTLPEAYPFALFDRQAPISDIGWQPQVIAISLGTNDFSTSVHGGEAWADATALAADYQATYVRFLADLRRRHPDAYLVVWATDIADGVVIRQAEAVVAAARAAGEARIGFVPVAGLGFAACHHHPDEADAQAITAAIAAHVDQQPGIWPAPAVQQNNRRVHQ